jgi:hypothetical protein
MKEVRKIEELRKENESNIQFEFIKKENFKKYFRK